MMLPPDVKREMERVIREQVDKLTPMDLRALKIFLENADYIKKAVIFYGRRHALARLAYAVGYLDGFLDAARLAVS